LGAEVHESNVGRAALLPMPSVLAFFSVSVAGSIDENGPIERLALPFPAGVERAAVVAEEELDDVVVLGASEDALDEVNLKGAGGGGDAATGSEDEVEVADDVEDGDDTVVMLVEAAAGGATSDLVGRTRSRHCHST